MSLAWGHNLKTDSIYYKIFATAPSIFFDLIGRPISQQHRFDSVEVKQTAFRIDGVFLPQTGASDPTVYFTEVQFQEDENLYPRLFGEIALFLKYHPKTPRWQAVVFFPRRSLEPPQLEAFEPFLSLPNVSRIYLDEPPVLATEPFAWGLMRLIVGSTKQAAQQARQLIQQAKQETEKGKALVELVETTMVYKFPNLGLEEIIKNAGHGNRGKSDPRLLGRGANSYPQAA